METTSPVPDSEQTLGSLLGMVRSELVRAMEAELATVGVDLRFTPFLILKRLGVYGPMSASELARSVDLDGGAMTRQLPHGQPHHESCAMRVTIAWPPWGMPFNSGIRRENVGKPQAMGTRTGTSMTDCLMACSNAGER